MTRTRYRNGEPTWGFSDEMIFIDGIGSWQLGCSEYSTQELLRRYIDATKERTEVWAIRARQRAIEKLKGMK